MMRLVLVDDQALVQQGVATLLEMSGVFTVVATLESGTALAAWLRDHPEGCDLVLLDFHMPAQDGIETLKSLNPNSAFPLYSSLPLLMLR